MKRLLLFLLLAGAGTALLVQQGGGLQGPHRERATPVVEERVVPRATGPKIDTPKGGITGIEGITQPGPPVAIVWEDRLSDDRIEIPTFTPWRFNAKDAKPLRALQAEQQGVLCTDVRFRVYRRPATRAEALALARGESEAYDELLHQSFTAREARVFGRLGEVLARRAGDEERALGDTQLQLAGDVVIVDRGQGIRIEGQDLTVWPEQERAEGRGAFVLEHEALRLRGQGLEMERARERGWSRVTVRRDAVLRITSEGRDKSGKPIFDFGPGNFRPADISSKGTAVLVRQDGRRESVITITLSDHVRAVQEGGRTLDAGRAEVVASLTGSPTVRRGSGWKLRHFRAGKGVKLVYPGRTRKGESYLATAAADRLIHDVPGATEPATVLEGDVSILMRGELELLGPEGRLRLACRDRAWFGPLVRGAATADLARPQLRQIALRGQARIERQTHGTKPAQDVLEADAIDIVVLPEENTEPRGSLDFGRRMLAVRCAALGDVRVDGTRIRGQTRRLVADGLDTERPTVLAEGEGTRFEFPNIGADQRLLGPDRAAQQAAGAEPDAPASAEGRWALQRLTARGRVDIDTSLGGPALGLPAHLTGDEISYDRVSRTARLRATGARPARVAWSPDRAHTSHLTTREILVDRAAGRMTASGGVQGELYVAQRAGRAALGLPARGDAERVRGGTLSVATDERIDIRLQRRGTSMEPRRGGEQIIRIEGPVTTELRGPDRSTDRMRSDTLELALVFLPPEARAAAPSAPTARAGAPEAQTPPDARPTEPLERLDLRAETLRVDLVDGDVARLEATGKAELKSTEGHVRGERMTYDRAAERIEVAGDAANPATAYLGSSNQRSEVQAERLRLTLSAGRPVRLEAHAPAGRTSDVQLYRDSEDKPGQVEWFAVTYEGRVTISDRELRAGRVRVIRRIREPGARAWGDAAILRAPALRVLGRRLLATEEPTRQILRLVAEGTASGTKNDVHFQSGRGEDLLQIWGPRFEFDVVGRTAELTGLPGRDVTMRKGAGLHSSYTRVVIDMKTNLPTASGSRIHWRPRDTKPKGK